MNERMKSRNTVIGILSVLLIAAVISGAILYREHLKTKDALQAIEKKLLNMNEEIVPSKNVQIADLKNRLKVNQSKVSDLEAGNAAIKTNLGRLQKKYDAVFSQLEGLEEAKEQITKLNQMISAKDQSISGLEEKISKLEKDLEEEQNVRKSLKVDLTAKEAVLAGLQNSRTADLEELKNAEGKISELESMISAKDQSISGLEEKISKLERDLEEEQNARKSLKADLTAKEAMLMGLQNTHTVDLEDLKIAEGKISELKSTINGRDQRISQLGEKLKDLEKESEKEKEEIERLRLALSDIEGKEEIANSEMGRLKSTYKKLVSDLHDQLKNYEVAIKTYRERISITFVDRILFDSGKADINAQGRRILKKVGETLKEVKGRQIRIVGHTDDVPIMKQYRYKFPTNWELSAARAAAVVRYFQKKIGLDPKNMEAVGRSSYQPVASNETEQGRARNRRVNIIIGPRIR